MSVPGKVLSLILLERLEIIIDPQLLESQCGFRQGRGTTDQIWLTSQIIERAVKFICVLLTSPRPMTQWTAGSPYCHPEEL